MNPRHKPLLLACVVIVVGAVLVLIFRNGAGQIAEQNPMPAPAAEATASSPEAAAPASSTPPADAFPWENNPPQPAAMPPEPPVIQPQAQTPAQIMGPENVAALREQVRKGQATADGMLRQLDELEAAGQAPKDMDIPALRNNVRIAKQAQALAMEMVDLTEKPDSPEKTRRIEEILAELQQLQGQLKTDIRLPSTTAPPSTNTR